MDRALREFRIRGVKTNIPFLRTCSRTRRSWPARRTTTLHRRDARAVRVPAAARPRHQAAAATSATSIVNGNPTVQAASPAATALREPRGARRTDADARRRRPAPADLWSSWARRSSRSWVREQKRAADHRHHLPRRAPVAAGHARAHLRHAARSPTRPRSICRELFSLEMWGGATFDIAMRFLHEDPVGAAARAARAGPEHPVPDAAARRQRRRLHQLPGQRRRGVRRGGGRGRHRRLPHLRLAQLAAETCRSAIEAVRETGRDRRGGHLLHRRHRRPEAHQVRLKYYVELAKELEKRGRPHPGDQGHGRPAASRRAARCWSRR